MNKCVYLNMLRQDSVRTEGCWQKIMKKNIIMKECGKIKFKKSGKKDNGKGKSRKDLE